jgi:hypothetical protein
MRKFLTLASASVLALFSYHPASAIERIGWSKTRQTMYVHGEIEKGDADLIANAIKANRRTLRGLILNSPGGSVVEAAHLVDLVRGQDFDTGVAPQGVCASACFIVWAAGKNRYVYADSRIGIHSANSIVNLDTGQRGENGVSAWATMITARAYFLLGVPMYLIGTMVVTPPESMYYLTDADKQAMSAQWMR